jgi:hypothetical protein
MIQWYNKFENLYSVETYSFLRGRGRGGGHKIFFYKINPNQPFRFSK